MKGNAVVKWPINIGDCLFHVSIVAPNVISKDRDPFVICRDDGVIFNTIKSAVTHRVSNILFKNVHGLFSVVVCLQAIPVVAIAYHLWHTIYRELSLVKGYQ